MTTIPEPPADLSEESRALWPGLAADVRATTGGAVVDYLVLADALRAQDRLAQVRATLAVEGVTIAGSKGQTRPHPLLIAERTLRRDVAEAFARLGLGAKDRWRYTVTAAGRLHAQ